MLTASVRRAGVLLLLGLALAGLQAVARAEEGDEAPSRFVLPSTGAGEEEPPEKAPEAKPKSPEPTGQAIKLKSGEIKESDEEESAQPVAIPTEARTRLEIEYPYVRKSVAYEPGYFSISEALKDSSSNSPNFHFSSYVLATLTLGGSLAVNPQFSIDGTLSFANYDAPATTLPLYTIQSASVNIFRVNVTPSYCFHPGRSDLLACMGMGIGLDGYPILLFVDNTHLSLSSFNDAVIRFTPSIKYPVTRFSDAVLKLGLDLGLLNNGSTEIQVNSHKTWWLEARFVSLLSPTLDLFAGLKFENKTTEFEELPDTWSASAHLFTLNVGLYF